MQRGLRWRGRRVKRIGYRTGAPVPPVTVPLVSIVVPAYNAVRYLPEALASARATGWPRIEMLVVDDGSTDDTVAVAEREWPGVRVFRQANAGPAAARNRALREATGDYIAFLDADDLWPADKLHVQVGALERHPEYVAAVGYMREFMRTAPDAEYVFADPVYIFVLGCMVCRREAFDRVGLLDDTMPGGYGEDTDWYMRAWEIELPILYLKDTTILYRQHPASLTADHARRKEGFLRAVKQSIARRRRNGDFRPLPNLYPQPLDASAKGAQ